MDNKNNNLENFFKAKFAALEDSTEAWTKPDVAVQQAVLATITASNKPVAAHLKALSSWILGLLLLSMLAYIGYLEWQIQAYQPIKDRPQLAKPTSPLPLQKQEQAALTATKNKPIQTDKTKATVAEDLPKRPKFSESQLNSTSNNQSAAQNNRSTHAYKTIKAVQATTPPSKFIKEASLSDKKLLLFLQNQLYKKDSIIRGLIETNNVLKNRLSSPADYAWTEVNQLRSNPSPPRAIQDKDTQPKSLNLKLSTAMIRPLSRQWNDTLVPSFLACSNIPTRTKIAKKTKWNPVFELGYDLALQGMLSELVTTIAHQRIAGENGRQAFLLAHAHGLNISLSPFKNCWIRSGFRVAFGQLNQAYDLGIAYNNSEEYLLQGDRVTDFSVSSSNAYTEAQNEWSYNIPNGTSDNDLIEFSLDEALEFTRYQIPLAVEYQLGKDKLKWILQIGSKWNILEYKHRVLNTALSSDNQALDPVENTALMGTSEPYREDRNKKTDHFMSLTAATGLTVPLSKKLHLRTLIAYEYNFNQSKNEASSSASNHGFSFGLGMNYRFMN